MQQPRQKNDYTNNLNRKPHIIVNNYYSTRIGIIIPSLTLMALQSMPTFKANISLMVHTTQLNLLINHIDASHVCTEEKKTKVIIVQFSSYKSFFHLITKKLSNYKFRRRGEKSR